MTSSENYATEQRLWKLQSQRCHDEIKAAFPDTDGNPNYLHNWHVCNHKDADDAARAQELVSFQHARWTRVRTWLRREYDRAQHREHITEGRVGAYLWCDACQATLGKRIEHYIDDKGMRVYRVVAIV